MKPILEIQNISKKFRIDHEKQPYLSLRDRISNLLHSTATKEDFWALKDVSFNVMPGDTVGIIGKNGAGKSTLLKILSKITPPTSGRIVSRGRIASLLEVGTGFHPELSGRENVFLNGSILGMKRAEILSKFDEIVDFAGVDRFIDTPLKHYSSGMQLRLAFAVAAFLQNEILIIDEVLAVGDAEFQKKCLGKMEDVSKSGRTVLFVSHHMSAVKELCQKGLLLSGGELKLSGKIEEAIKSYSHELLELHYFVNGTLPIQNKNIFLIESFSNGKPTDYIKSGEELTLKIHFKTNRRLVYPILGIVIKDFLGNPVIGINNKHYQGNLISNSLGSGIFTVTFPHIHLFQGDYLTDVYLGDEHIDFEIIKDCFVLRFEKNSLYQASETPSPELNKIFYNDVQWQLTPTNA